jgi:hypothetical protein
MRMNRPVLPRAAARALLLLLLLLALPGGAGAGYVDHGLRFSRDDLSVSVGEDGHRVRLAGADLTLTPGDPELPAQLLQLALPAGVRVDSVTVLAADWLPIPGRFSVVPVAEPVVLSHADLGLPGPRPFPPRSAAYESDAWCPTRLVQFTGDGSLGGVHVADFVVHPVRHAPRSGRLELCRDMVFRVHTSAAPPSRASVEPGGRRDRAAARLAARLVANPQVLADLEPRFPTGSRPFPQDEGVDYLIITANSFAAALRPLAAWKTRKGLRVRTVTVEAIDAEYAAVPERPARIRECIRDAYTNDGITYVLLAGDCDRVEERTAYAMTSGAVNPTYDKIPADLYYADLDGDWNANGSEPYGEVADAVDLYPDVLVGRLPALDAEQAAAMVSKILTYERAPPLDFQTRMLMTGEILWSDPYTDSGEGLDHIDETSVPARFDPIEKLYESLGNESEASVLAALNSGPAYWLHNGHGHYDLMSVGQGALYAGDMAMLTNGSRLALCYSISCLSAGFDYESCIAERWVRNPDGGGIAFVGNARFGWGSPGNPRFGYSDRLQQKFFSLLFVQGEHQLGRLLALTKAAYVPQSRSENVYRWHQYSVNLLGDPELSLWTDTPAPLAVAHPESIPLASTSFAVTVGSGGSPCAGAVVCVTDDAGLHRVARTDATGQVRLPLTIAVAGSLFVTVTAPDHLPYEGVCTVVGEGPRVVLAGATLDDGGGGNGNSRLNAGESVELLVELANSGTQPATSVSAILRAADTTVIVTDSTDAFGDVPAGESRSGAGFAFDVAADAAPGHACSFTLEIHSGGGEVWFENLGLPIAAPVLVLHRLAIDDAVGGNGNGRVDPGESFRLAAVFRNDGSDSAASTEVVATTLSPLLTWTESAATLLGLGAGDSCAALLAGEVSAACPDPSFLPLHFALTSADGYAFAESTVLVVGATGFADDLESGGSHWTHEGTNDHWHLSSERCHSGSSAWYCGRADTRLYESNTSARLAGPFVRLAPSPRLSFWLWHELATFGVDGLYVILERAAAADTLDFIASGGALGTLPIGAEWLEFAYELTSFGLAAGDEARLVLVFVSDGDTAVAEGCYLDDILLTGVLPDAASAAAQPRNAIPLRTALTGVAPNPLRCDTTVRFSLARPGLVELAVYDVRGRRVRVLVEGVLPAGLHTAAWGGRAQSGDAVGSGVYFLRLTAGEERHTAKLIVLH